MQRWEKLAVAGIVAGLAAALVYQAWALGITMDEPSHLLSASLYWQGADRLQPRDMPPLIKITGGWVPALLKPPVPYDHKEIWATQHEWNISYEMIQRMSGAELERLVFLSRLPLIIFPLLTTLLIWRWGRSLFTPLTGVLVALAYAMEPTALGHGALFKNDIAATFGFLFFWYRAWRFWNQPSRRTAAWLGIALLVAINAKLSMLFLVPIAPLVVLLRYRRGWLINGACLVPVLLVLGIPYLGSLTTYQFEVNRVRGSELRILASEGRVPRVVILASNAFRLLPVAQPMWRGAVSLLHSDASDNAVYLLGERRPRGHPLYFLVALAVKAPVPLILIVAGGLVLIAWSAWHRRFDAKHLFWLVPPLLYIVLASLSALQLGLRLILPALPFGLLIAGVAIERMLRARATTAAVACLIAWLGIASATVYPRGISFFNVISGGPERALDYLADSNVDWGQDLPELAELVRQRGFPKIRLSYFGTDNPFRYFKESQLELIAPPWSSDLVKTARLKPEPGYYAISASLLPGHFFSPEYRDYYGEFRKLRPVAKAGYSIFVYRIGR